MNNSITKALLFVIALSTSIMAVQLIPISRKAYLFNLCRDYNASWNEGNLLANKKGKEEELTKAVAKTNVYLKKIYKELGIILPYMGKKLLINFVRGLVLIGLLIYSR